MRRVNCPASLALLGWWVLHGRYDHGLARERMERRGEKRRERRGERERERERGGGRSEVAGCLNA